MSKRGRMPHTTAADWHEYGRTIQIERPKQRGVQQKYLADMGHPKIFLVALVIDVEMLDQSSPRPPDIHWTRVEA